MFKIKCNLEKINFFNINEFSHFTNVTHDFLH